MVERRLDSGPSLSAQFNAAQRAAESLRPPNRRLFHDPFARHFVEHPALRVMLATELSAHAVVRACDRMWGGLHAHIALRARYAEQAFQSAVAEGITQIVLLGAGFDTTILRHTADAVTFFEVDAPTTQACKRARVERLLPADRHCRIAWIPCDLEHDKLDDKLTSGGFDSTARSLILWLGVTPYLQCSAIAATLSDLSKLCSSGSRIVIDHLQAGVVDTHPRWKSAARVRRMVARRGEPYRTDFTQPALDSLLSAHEFQPLEHLDVSALLKRYDPDNASGLASDNWLGVVSAQRK